MLTRLIARSVWSDIIVYLLIFIFFVEPAFLRAGNEKPENRIEYSGTPHDEFEEFQENSEKPGPNRPKDSFRLVNQALEVWDQGSGSYKRRLFKDSSLGDPLIMADFLNLTDLRATILAHNQFALIKEKSIRDSSGRRIRGASARHVFELQPEDGRVIDVQFDREFLYVLTDKTKVFAVYMPLAKTGAFNHAIPLIHLTTLPSSIGSDPTNLPKLKFAFRAHRPLPSYKLHPDAVFPKDRLEENKRDQVFQDLPDDFPFVGSDLIIYRGSQKNTEILAILDSTVSLARVRYGLVIAGQMAAAAAGMPLLPELQQLEISQDNWSLVSSDPLLMAAFRNLGANYLDLVASRAQAESKIINPPVRDRFTSDEWRKTYEKFEQQALQELFSQRLYGAKPPSGHSIDLVIGKGAGQTASGTERVRQLLNKIDQNYQISAQKQKLLQDIESGELDLYLHEFAQTQENDPRPSFLKRIFNKKNMNRLAASLSLGSAILFGGSYIDTGDYLLWALYLIQSAYEWMPEALHKEGYTFPYLITAVAFLSMGVPILWVIGQITSNLLGGKRRGFDFKRALGWLATVQFARLVKMFYITGIEAVLRNPTFITMLQRSMNPFRRIKADSELGRRLGLHEDMMPGLSIPGFGERWRAKIQEKRRIIGKLYEEKLNARSIALLLSIFLVSHENKLDPATVFQLMKEGKLPIPQDEAERQAFEKKWSETVTLLIDVFEGLASAKGFKSLSELQIEEFEAIYHQAKEIADELKYQKILNPEIVERQERWRAIRRYITETSIPFFASWGVKQSEILRNSLISQPLANESWRSTIIDYYFTTIQQAIVGGRADFSQPQMLYADPQGTLMLGFANPANVSDTVEQLAIHGIAVPSRNLIDFQTGTPLDEKRYTPMEHFQLPRNIEHQTWTEGIRKWLSGVFNLEQLTNFGEILWRSMYANRVKMIQSGVLFSVVPRIALAGQSIGEAFAAWSFVWFLAPFFAFVWPFTVIGNTKLEIGTQENYEELKNAQALISQGLRLHDKKLLKRGLKQLSSYYSSLPQELKAAVKEAEEVLADPNFEVTHWLAFERHLDKVLDLWEAIQIRNSRVELFQKSALHNQTEEAVFEEENQAIRNAAEALKSLYQEEEPKAMSAEQLLVYSLQKPPFATVQNKWLQNAATFFVGVIPSTYIASFLFAYSYSEDMNWGTALPVAATAGVGTFLGIRYALQKGLQPLAQFTQKAMKIVVRPFRQEQSLPQQIQARRAQLSKELKKNSISITNLPHQNLQSLIETPDSLEKSIPSCIRRIASLLTGQIED